MKRWMLSEGVRVGVVTVSAAAVLLGAGACRGTGPVAPGGLDAGQATAQAPLQAGSAGARETPPIARAADTSTGDRDIVVNTEAMAGFPCHAMGNMIMGDCSPADIERLKAELQGRDTTAGGHDSTGGGRDSGSAGGMMRGTTDAGAPGAMSGAGGSRMPTSDANVLAGIRGRLPGGDTPPAQLPPVALRQTMDIANGSTVALDARIVRGDAGGQPAVLYAYNGQIPGPLLKVRQGSTMRVVFTNRIDQPTTVHWHGLRLDNASDGVPGVTQEPVAPGGTFTYTLSFPDPGIYWYHPHVREDIQQDGGLYGNILVVPQDEAFANPVGREEVLAVDDVLVGDEGLVPYGDEGPNFAIMGRYGNRMLVNGSTAYALRVGVAEVVRFYVTNVANVRPFRLSFGGARMKLVGGDAGPYEREQFVDAVTIAPAERYVFEVLFDEVRTYRIVHSTPGGEHTLGSVTVERDRTASTAQATTFWRLGANAALVAEVASLRAEFDRAPDIDLELTVDMPGMVMAGEAMQGMMAGDHADGIEWEDSMTAMNAPTTSADVTWMIRDRKTGSVNADISYRFAVGDHIRVRLFNNPASMHPMQHPFHIHGQRFLVLATDGRANDNLVWKDTVLVPVGSTADLLLDVTNPGTWVAHCHIPEHMESGMMFAFDVVEP